MSLSVLWSIITRGVKRIPSEAYALAFLCSVVFGIALWLERTLDRAEQRGRESVHTAAARIITRFPAESAAAMNALRTAKARADQQHRRDSIRWTSNAATARLEESIRALNDSVAKESSVLHVVDAGRGLAAENDTLKQDLRETVEAARNERAASDSVHVLDQREIGALRVTVVATQDTARTAETERDQRVKKATVAKIAGGVATVAVIATKLLWSK